MSSKKLTMKERETLFSKRTQYYLKQGYDRIKAAELVVHFAGELNSPALDVGAGKGVLSMALARKGLSVVAVDPNKYDLELASYLSKKGGLFKKIKFLSLDAKNLPFKDCFFKTVAMMNVLHHIENGEPLLKEMARVLSKDGKMIIAEFDEEGFNIVAKAHQSEGTIHPRSDFTLERANSVLQKVGLKIVLKTNKHFNDIAILVK
jgi:ubiquinone/menaquinone biosynthesis C-methylase UbiE